MSERADRLRLLQREVAAHARVSAAEVAADAHLLTEVGLSSIDLLRVLAFAEQQFSARFPDVALGDLVTLERIMDAVEQHAVPRGG
jgi:acyl carrier protein